MSSQPQSDPLLGINAVEEAENRAFQRGQVREKESARMAVIEHRQGELNGDVKRMGIELEGVKLAIQTLHEDFRIEQRMTSAYRTDVAKREQEQKEDQISSRKLFWTAFGSTATIIGALVGLLAATGAFH